MTTSTKSANQATLSAVRGMIQPLTGAGTDYDALLDMVGASRFVLIGEASHGTHEFYRERANITQRLIAERGFRAVVAEADWPDAYRANCYAQGAGADQNADQALSGFERFPTWMWRNTVLVDFIEWLRVFNADRPSKQRPAGFYGMDLYSLHASIAEVIAYLERVDPDAAQRARDRYACFEFSHNDPQAYGYATSVGVAEPCEDEVVAQLVDLQRRAAELAKRDGGIAEDELFRAEQNARLVKNAEEYYRAMFHGRASTWNLRDRHMVDTLDALVAHLDRDGGERTKVVVWAHNSHLGDARATEMGAGGEVNVGQLVRQRHSGDCVLFGLTTHHGTVTAATDWGGPAERKQVRPGMPTSYEGLLHDVGTPSFLLPLRGQDADGLREPRLERAIGVIYRPDTERMSHYFYADLPSQFDAVLHFDETRALEPLERTQRWEQGELPETYPFASDVPTA